jgi:pimeloyl-ACP methyl ester carboxylesterase
MTYVEERTGEPIVFVHGAVSDERAWEPVRPVIADEHRFIAPTLRYFGKGDWPDNGQRFGAATHANDVNAFVRALGIRPVHLVGWSYDGNVAMAAALESPDLVRTLILLEPALDGFIKEDEAGAAAREAAGAMFGPSPRRSRRATPRRRRNSWWRACSKCRPAASTGNRRSCGRYSSTTRGRCRCFGMRRPWRD